MVTVACYIVYTLVPNNDCPIRRSQRYRRRTDKTINNSNTKKTTKTLSQSDVLKCHPMQVLDRMRRDAHNKSLKTRSKFAKSETILFHLPKSRSESEQTTEKNVFSTRIFCARQSRLTNMPEICACAYVYIVCGNLYTSNFR